MPEALVPAARGGPAAGARAAGSGAPSGKHLPALDGLRALAILLVLWLHSMSPCNSDFWTSPALALYARLVYQGRSGVQLFFVLSGFLITGILIDARERPGYFSSFYARRALRIFPLYYLALAVFFWAGPLYFGDQPSFQALRAHQGWYWSYLQNWNDGLTPELRGFTWLVHFWTLAVEEQFYLLWPAIVWLVAPRKLRWWAAGMMALSPLVHFAMMRMHVEQTFIDRSTPTNLECLGAGALLAIAARQGGLLRWRRAIAIAGAAGLALLAAGFLLTRGEILRFSPGGLGYALVYGAALTFAVTAAPGSRWRRLLENPALRHLGARSYAVYVVHQPLMQWMQTWWPLGGRIPVVANHLLFMLAGGLLALGIAEVTWRLIEKPCLALKRHFPAPGERAAGLAAGPAPSAP